MQKRFLRFFIPMLIAAVLLVPQFVAAAPVKLTWYMIYTPQQDQSLVTAEANKIIQRKLGCTVDIKVFDWGEYETKMRTIIAAREPFDLCFTANWVNNYQQNASRGAYLPLDVMLDRYAPQLKALVGEKFWDTTRINGHIYGSVNLQIECMTAVVYFQKKLVDKYKFDYKNCKKFEDLEPFLKAVKENEPGVFPTDFVNQQGGNFGKALTYHGFSELAGRNVPGAVYLSDKPATAKVINQFATPEFKNWCQLARDWYKKGYIRSDALSINNADPEIKAGKIACGLGGTYKPGGAAEASARFGLELVEIPFSKSYFSDNPTATMHAISSNSRYPELAMKLLNLINTDKKLYNLLSYGIEGKHYKKVGPNRIEPLKGSKFMHGCSWEIGCVFNGYLLPGQPDDCWEETKKMNDAALPAPVVGFNFNPKPVEAEISQCVSVVNEFLSSLELGVADPAETLPKFLDKLQKAGADKLIAEIQKQLEDWKKAKD